MAQLDVTTWRSRIAVLVWLAAPAAVALAGPAPGRAHIEGAGMTAPITSDPFNGPVTGDVSDGEGLLPPAGNPPSAGAVVATTALPGAHITQTRFGPIDDMDRLFLSKARQAGLWERPTALLAQKQASNPRLREISGILASGHIPLARVYGRLVTAVSGRDGASGSAQILGLPIAPYGVVGPLGVPAI
jgi:hypothetical protein